MQGNTSRAFQEEQPSPLSSAAALEILNLGAGGLPIGRLRGKGGQTQHIFENTLKGTKVRRFLNPKNIQTTA